MSITTNSEDQPAKMSPDTRIPPIQSEICKYEPLTSFPSVERRYYTRYFTPPYTGPPSRRQRNTANGEDDKEVADKERNPGMVLLHSNRICLVSLSPHHPVARDKMEVKKLDFQVRFDAPNSRP